MICTTGSTYHQFLYSLANHSTHSTILAPPCYVLKYRFPTLFIPRATQKCRHALAFDLTKINSQKIMHLLLYHVSQIDEQKTTTWSNSSNNYHGRCLNVTLWKGGVMMSDLATCPNCAFSHYVILVHLQIVGKH